MRKIIFNASLPRTGSILLQCILGQNPNIYPTSTSGCLETLFVMRNMWHLNKEHKAHPDDEALKRILKSILFTYHSTDKKIIIDKERGWFHYLEMAEELLEQKAKILVCIRSIPDILASFEKLYRNTSKLHQVSGEAKQYIQFQTIEGRCEYIFAPEGVLGLPYLRLRDALNRGFKDRMLFIPYDKFTKEPETIAKQVYDFIEEPYFKHNFNYIENILPKDVDEPYIDLHKIRSSVEYSPTDAETILGKALVNKYSIFNLY